MNRWSLQPHACRPAARSPRPASLRRVLPLRVPVADAVNAAAATPAAAVPGTAVHMPLTALVSGHVVQDGEIILMVLKPSRWFILFNSLRFAGVVVATVVGLLLWNRDALGTPNAAAQLAVLLISGRVMASILQWMGRYYLLTDWRVLRLSGVFTPEISSCPLRKVAHTRLTRSFRERLVGLGSIDVEGQDGTRVLWQTLRHCDDVHHRLNDAVARCKQNGCGGG